MKFIIVFIIFLLTKWSNHSTFALYNVCVKPSSYVGDSNQRCKEPLEWSVLLKNIPKYFTSHTQLLFLPGVYNLNTHLPIENVTNLVITGATLKPALTIQCVTTNTALHPFISISNSTSVRIQNITIKNCGTNIQNYVCSSSHLSRESAAVLLYNVSSILINNLNIQNNHGYGIVGINVIGNSVIKRVTIFCTPQKSSMCNNVTRTVGMGGLALLYINNISYTHNHTVVENVLIVNFTLCNAQEVNKLCRLSGVHSSSAIEIAFYQHNFSINVTILNATIKNIALKSKPLLFITFNSSATNYVAIHNSSFTNNNIANNSIIYILMKAKDDHSAKMSEAYFKLSYSRIISNVAITVCTVLQPDKQGVPLKFKIYSSMFGNNKVRKTFLNASLMINTHTVAIEHCYFTCNAAFKLNIYNVPNMTLIGNIFRNNSVQHLYRDYAILTCDNKTHLTFEGYNEFSYNAANFILKLHRYIFIREYSVLNISYNEPLTQTKYTALIYFKNRFSIFWCLFQFLSLQGNLDEEFLHNNTNFSLMFDGNKGYYSHVHGSKLNSCHWKEKTAFKLLTPGNIYKRVLHLDVNIENVIGRQYATFCFCEGETHTDCITDHFGPIFPGQIIPVRLKQVLPVDKSISFTAIRKRFFTFSKSPIPYEQCSLVLSHEPKWVQQIDTRCTPLSFKVHSASNNLTTCFATLSAIGADDSTYLYYFDFKACPLGFDMYNGSCECNRHLKHAFPNILCDIETQTIIRPGRSWIGLSSSKNKILYVCEKVYSNIL